MCTYIIRLFFLQSHLKYRISYYNLLIHSGLLHSLESELVEPSTSHSSPPYCGAGLLQFLFLVRIPWPQVAGQELHASHCDQLPCTRNEKRVFTKSQLPTRNFTQLLSIAVFTFLSIGARIIIPCYICILLAEIILGSVTTRGRSYHCATDVLSARTKSTNQRVFCMVPIIAFVVIVFCEVGSIYDCIKQ